MKLTLSSSPHQRVSRDTGQIMRFVIFAMIPGILCQWYFFGWGVIIQSALAVIVAVAFEAGVLFLRGKAVERTLSDYSAVLTGLLLAVSIPPTLPWWMTVIGIFFAIVVAKQVYGGLGYNMFNPAMIGYVVLLISFPAAMTMWVPPFQLAADPIGLADTLHLIFTGFTQAGYDISQLREGVDGVTMATPLDTVKTGLTQGYTYPELVSQNSFSNEILSGFGAGWGWVSVAYLAGGLALLKARVINWSIPGSMIISVITIASSLYLYDAGRFASPLFHLLNGALMIGAFFIATDPVSASTTPRGRLIFGAAIGFWIVIIRTFGGYPDAVAFSVIIMNMAVPLIDYYTRPRTYGHQQKRSANKRGH